MTDLLIIGGGPAGYVAAERAGSKGLSVILFEKKTLGGVCLNEGCIPTKTLLYSAKLYENAKNGEKYGVVTENVSIEYDKMILRKNKIVRKLVAGVKTKMKTNNVTVVEGDAKIVSSNENEIVVTCNDEKYTGKNLLICTGSEAAVPPIPGLSEAGETIVTNREILSSKEQPQSIIVIGGGVIGIEFASFYNSLGTKVTVIEMLPEILTGNDIELASMLRTIYTKKGVEFHMNSRVVKIDDNTVTFENNGETHTATADKILISVGRRPNTKNIGLEEVGIELHKSGIKVDEKMRTNLPNIYAAGDVTGFSLLAHTASREAEVVVNNLTKNADIMKYNAIPAVVYTNPELAGVGETEESAKNKGMAIKVVKLPMTFSGRFVAENEGETGLCKVLIGEKHGEVVGVHMLGNPASEIIYGAAMAIQQEMTLEEMKKVVFPHPTVSEILKEILFEF